MLIDKLLPGLAAAKRHARWEQDWAQFQQQRQDNLPIAMFVFIYEGRRDQGRFSGLYKVIMGIKAACNGFIGK